MLKRFIRDCVDRDPAVYSPWIVKPQLAARYGIPTEMSDEIREEIESFRERQMDRRKRERDERLGLVEEEEVVVGRKKVKKEVEVKGEEDKKKPMKFPAEGMCISLVRGYRIELISDLLVEYVEKDEKEGRILVRPAVGRNLPFGDGFEKLLLAWSFLNVMGYVNFLILSLPIPLRNSKPKCVR